MALGTITVIVNSLTNNAYSGFSNTLIAAYYYCSSKLGADISIASGTVGTDAVATNDNEGLVVAQLTASLLSNGKQHADPEGTPKSIDDLFTTEMSTMLLAPDEQDEGLLDYSNDQPEDTDTTNDTVWEVF